MDPQTERIEIGRKLLGASVRRRRIARDLTMRDVSRITALSYDTITSVEYGRVLASLGVLDLIAQALDTSVRDLLTDVFPWDGNAPPPPPPH